MRCDFGNTLVFVCVCQSNVIPFPMSDTLIIIRILSFVSFYEYCHIQPGTCSVSGSLTQMEFHQCPQKVGDTGGTCDTFFNEMFGHLRMT